MTIKEKIQKRLEEVSLLRERALASLPDEVKPFLVLLEQNQKMGKLPPGTNADELKAFGAWVSNEGFVFLPIKVPYVAVDGRLKLLWLEFPQGVVSIETTVEGDTVKATVNTPKGLATAHARIGTSEVGVDATNPIENAETSAVGRALGFLGYGLLGTGVASAEEVQGALKAQEKTNGAKENEDDIARKRVFAFLDKYLQENKKVEDQEGFKTVFRAILHEKAGGETFPPGFWVGLANKVKLLGIIAEVEARLKA